MTWPTVTDVHTIGLCIDYLQFTVVFFPLKNNISIKSSKHEVLPFGTYSLKN